MLLQTKWRRHRPKSSGPSKERINIDPAFIQVKGNNQEFAAAVYLTKSISIGLGPVVKDFHFIYETNTTSCDSFTIVSSFDWNCLIL